MFFTYLRRELRRRSKQATVVAVGLAVGIGLVMTVSAASAGVKDAQGQVLHSLYGVGTDMTVTKTANASGFGPQRFRFGNGSGNGGGGSGGSTRPTSGKISRNTLRPAFGEATLSSSSVAAVRKIQGVEYASGGLSLSDTKFSGTIPNFGSGSGSGSAGLGSAPSVRPNFSISSFTVDGVEITRSEVGPLTSADVTKGAYFSPTDNNAMVAIVSKSYASQHSLSVGSSMTVAGKKVSVIGLANTSASGADVYLPLGTAQTLASLKGDVTTIYVSVASSSQVSGVASAIQRAFPKATVTTSASLAKTVTGSITSAANLASNLGKWLSWAALIVAFLVAGLLMMAAVSRRVREFGTLKAIGWRTRRIVGQVMGEGVTLGIAGGVAGILLGLGGAALVSAISPALTATVGSAFSTSGGFPGAGGSAGSAGGLAPVGGFSATNGSTPTGSFPSGGGAFFRHNAATPHTVLVHLSAPLQTGAVGLAIALAIAGGLVAGGFGSWRAARLRPADALRRVE